MIGARPGRLLLKAVIVPTAGALLLLAAMVGAVLHFATEGSDAVAAQRQARLVEVAMLTAVTGVRKDQEASTYWDDAVRRVHEVPLDLPWIDQNLGIWFHSYYKHDETYVLDARERPVYAMRNGRRADPRQFSGIAPGAQPLVAQLRAKLRRGDLAAASSVEQTPGASTMAMVRGRPAIVSVKPILSETGEITQRPGSEHLHLSVRYLDGNFLTDLAADYGVEAPRFVTMPSARAAIPLWSAEHRLIGYIEWQAFRPGHVVKRHMAIVLLTALGLIGAVLAWLLNRNLRARLELETSRAQAQHLAFHDALTGLPNRALFNDRTDHALARTRRGEEATLLLLDLDRFKHVNDTFGHQAGDELIREFGSRLTALVREVDTIARLGGDEFAILLPQLTDKDAIDGLCQRILSAVHAPFEVLGNQAFVGVSIGVVQAPAEGTDRVDLMRKADIALYKAKAEGRDCYRHFDLSMDATVKLRGTVEEDLRSALATGEGLALHYQPLVGTDGKMVGVEALLRWVHPEQGLLPPAQVIPIAEETGLIIPLGEWVLRESCAAAKRWPDLFVALNLSPVQFRTTGFAERVLEIIRETGVRPEQLELEVTEGVLIDDDELVRAGLAQLRAAGLRIALDDFGTGYSSLSYLRKFEVDKIKIDRSFVQHLGHTVDSAAIIHAVVTLGHAMGLTVTAEGVETGDQQRFLKLAGCNQMQGYLFSRPVPAGQITALVAQRCALRAA
ncbi:putative bifunctional diguanylate cyclase/phosphodiesterase [Sphingomonas psychrotolerans]|uniref:putative bifunctional diguanylate cyclase/phosphodiesterase n=1 Tax=Sphingomonas psychrotolerans TaxID=1327635 RepID=UPI001F258BDE|nr:EAL domain-containing protein [Sphingomonas psychrotolerans]